jgi:hypothetical protein
MQSDKSLHELIEGIRIIIAKDMIEKRPQPRRKPVADPALWRAIETQQKMVAQTTAHQQRDWIAHKASSLLGRRLGAHG